MAKVQYIPVYADVLKAMREANVSADQLGRALYATLELFETGERPAVDPDIMLPFILFAQKLEESIAAYENKVATGRASAEKRYSAKDPAPDPEEADAAAGDPAAVDNDNSVAIGTHGNPKNNWEPIKINKNKKEINKNKKEKINKKEKATARSGTNRIKPPERDDDLNDVLNAWEERLIDKGVNKDG